MATVEAYVKPSPAPPVNVGVVRFLGSQRAYWRLRVKGALLVLITLGLYRFWLATDVRRFLWSNTEIAGDTLEYSGLATELLIGFLIAIAIVVPFYTTFAVVALADQIAATSVLLGFALVAVLGEYARFRARRYRLTRTVFRGVRFDQHGSAWMYALRALAWWAVSIFSLGLAYPWAVASLERYKMRNTSYGDLDGGFAGSGLGLFLRGLPLWLLVVGPVIVALVAAVTLVDWDALNQLLDKADDDATVELMATMFGPAFGIAIIAVGVSAVSLMVLYPVFQAVKLRWWISGLRFGSIAVTSRLRIVTVYRVYLGFLLYLLLFMMLVGAVGAGCLAAIGALHLIQDSSAAELAGSAVSLLLYVVVALGASTLYQIVVTAGLWRHGAQSAAVAGVDALDHVRATGAPSSALGEGLADALGVGSI
jgi:uncharacterized membrane protein YjgN (DUF898 family)